MLKAYRLPALANSSFLRYLIFTVLYLAEGMQMGLLFVAIPAWMAVQGKTVPEVGAFAVACAMPWTFKFVVAPLMDRYTFLPMGRKRPWVIGSQLGLVAALLCMALVSDPLNNLSLFNSAAFLVSTFGAIQDGATDGMAVDVLPAEEQARANGLMGGARMIGSSLALAVGSWLINTRGFGFAATAIAGAIGVLTLFPVLLREHPAEKMLPWSGGAASPANLNVQVPDWRSILKALYSVFRLRNSILISLLLLLSMGAYNFFETLLPVFAVKMTSWINTDYAKAFAAADLIGGIGGIFLGGYLIEKFGKKKMISIYFLLIIGMALSLAVLKEYWGQTRFLYGFLIGYRWLNAFAKIGVYAVAMQCCLKKISASQFTFYMTFGALGSMLGATLIGPLKESGSWEITFYAFSGMLGLALIVLHLINLERQTAKIAALEAVEEGG